MLAILFVQLLYGAWVAGLDAGQVAPSWPDMQGRLFPAGIDWSRGIGWALVNDPYLVHFIHRWWAWVAVAALVVFARRVKRIDAPTANAPRSPSTPPSAPRSCSASLTVLTGVAIWLAALHQAVGALLVVAVVWGAHLLGRPRDAE